MSTIRSMVMLSLFSLSFFIALPAGADDARAKIQLLENTQSLDPGGWRGLTSHDDSDIRRLSIRAIGRIDHPRLSRFIRSGLSDSDASVRAESAFAYGQSTTLSPEPLVMRLKIEEHPEVIRAVYAALGKRGNSAHRRILVEALSNASPVLTVSLLEALQRLHHRFPGFDDRLNTYLSRSGFNQENTEVRLAWAQCLSQFQEQGCEARRQTITECLRDPDAEIRAVCASATTCLTDGASLRLPLLDDSNWQVKVATLLTMGDNADIEGLVTAFDMVAARFWLSRIIFDQTLPVPRTENVVIMALIEAALRTKKTKKINRVVTDLWKTIPTHLSETHCGLAAILDRHEKTLKRTKRCGSATTTDTQRQIWQLKAARGLSSKTALRRILKIMKTGNETVRVHALQLLGEYPAEKKAIRAIKKSMMNSSSIESMAAVDVAAELSIDGFESELRSTYEFHSQAKNHAVVQRILHHWGQQTFEASLEILESHLDDRHPGTRRAAAYAHRAVTAAIRANLLKSGEAPSRAIRRRPGLPPPSTNQNSSLDARLTKPAAYSMANIQTNAGTIRIRLLKKDALNTVKHFVSLVKKGRYENAAFHSQDLGESIRVGDPSLTGFGGFEPNRNCEIYPSRFRRGSLGLYQRHRDGGGAQLILAQRSIPAFDGRFTLFGQVIEGLEVLDTLKEGDTILKVELLSSP